MKCRAYYDGDKIIVVHPVWKNKKDTETDEDFLDRITAKAVKGKEWQTWAFIDMETSSLPDRKDKKYWKIKDNKVIVDKGV